MAAGVIVKIIRTSIIGIIANVFLAAFKAVIGILSHSIAITLDAVNNISDAASSVITIVGTKLAGKPADKKHPFGYGRIEYLSAMIISVIVLYAGITSFTESVKNRPAIYDGYRTRVDGVDTAVHLKISVIDGQSPADDGQTVGISRDRIITVVYSEIGVSCLYARQIVVADIQFAASFQSRIDGAPDGSGVLRIRSFGGHTIYRSFRNGNSEGFSADGDDRG